jgi:hypothetical protein
MKRVKRLVWVVVIGVLLWTQRARAAAHVEFIDVGTPKSGSLTMDGWRGVIVRVSLDDGLPITNVDLGNAFGLGIYGNVAERWTDPQGHSTYTESSPGPVAANNLTDSDFNFDTHFLPVDNGTYQPSSLREFIGTGGPLITARDPIPSTPFVGYGATVPERVTIREEPILLAAGGNMRASLQVPPEAQLNSVDVAYVVADGLFTVDGRINSGGQFFDVHSTYDVPEPSSLLVPLVGMGAWAGSRRRRLR